jgi:hypothetical protein
VGECDSGLGNFILFEKFPGNCGLWPDPGYLLRQIITLFSYFRLSLHPTFPRSPLYLLLHQEEVEVL